MKQNSEWFLALILMLTSPPAIAMGQETKSPFAELDRRVKQERGGWAGSKEDFSRIFDAERRQLGDRFEPELMRYLGTDVEKHYWISVLLVYPGYLHGSPPLRHLALLIDEQALSLLAGKSDKQDLGNVVSLSVDSAVLAETLGLHSLARAHKQEAERLLASENDFGAWFPALTTYEHCLYDSIGKNISAGPCKKDDDLTGTKPLVLRVAVDVLDHRAIEKPDPVYPPEVRRISGEVLVAITTDETGKVEEAHALSGPPLLQAAAVAAAFKARFAPTLLGGKPARVIGTLRYKFRPSN